MAVIIGSAGREKQESEDKKMKRFLSIIAAAAFLFSIFSVSALAEEEVDLTSKNGKLLISEAGVYTLKGSMRGTVEIDPGAGDVELILDNMTINGSADFGIRMLSGDSLKLTLAQDSQNSISGAPAVFSNAPMTIDGSGILTVSADGLPIQAMKNYRLSGGTLIAMGTKPVETPVFSAQNMITVNMDKAFPANTYVTLQSSNAGRQFAFSSDRAFTSVMMSKANLAKDTYQLSADSVPVSVNGDTTFNVLSGMNTFNGTRSAAQTANAWTGIENEEYAPSNETVAAFQPASQNRDNRSYDVQTSANNQAQPSFFGNNGTMPVNGGNAPAIQGGANAQQQGVPGQAGMGMQPGGNNSNYVSADSPSEVVTSAMENSAASLEADMDNAETIVMSEQNSQVKISDSGTYVVTGSSSDGNITVKKSTTGVVLILEDLDLTSTTGATVSINKEAEVKVIISGNVTLTDAENPDDENSTDEAIADAFDGAAIKAKAGSNVYITGDGTLNIYGNAKNGIKAGDDTHLMIDGVTLNIKAANDGINANYDLSLLSGSITIEAGDDAIHADHILTVGKADGTGPKINITGSEEGLEGTVVNIYGGDISVRANDDAINAANKDGLYESELRYAVNVMGGSIAINSGYDGIDSNGDVNLIAGSATITSANMGGDAGIDYDGDLYISDQFSLNNSSGVAGPDGMPGQMNGQQPGNMNGQNGQMTPPDMNGQNSQQTRNNMDGQNGQQNFQNMNGQSNQQTPFAMNSQQGSPNRMEAQQSMNPPSFQQGWNNGANR